MDKQILKGKWTQLKGEAKLKWQKFTDDDLDKIGGEYDKLVGKLQEKYGYAKDRIEKEIDELQEEWQSKQKQTYRQLNIYLKGSETHDSI